MSAGRQFEPSAQSLFIAKIILGLSFVLPYLIGYPSSDLFPEIMIYAPIWVLQLREGLFWGGLTPLALVMFYLWLPYVLMGYQVYRYANGTISSKRNYLLSIILLTVISLFFAISLSLNPTGSMNGEDAYTIAIPIPIIPLLALLSIRALRSVEIIVPWTEESQHEEPDSTEESIRND